MEIKSCSDCLNRTVIMIFEKNLKCLVKGNLADKRKQIEWQQADVVARGGYIEERLAVLSVLSRINHITEIVYSDDTEEDLDQEYNKLRQKS